ncbi:MAG TPA: adenylate/guanylate cyclase domain-containing protein [Gaiellaceae bacterium]|nr:adenylate/guanylate cyclase domain-containing protein [Gaiellaceae bacterium]
MIVCASCGEENPERARFCLACGAALGVDALASEERKVVSVLFVDLVGFTAGADRADPEDVRATLRPYHERVKADIERFGGTVEKFIGDAVMAVFGAPVAHEDDAERAVRSALRILETMEELRDDGLDLAVRAAVTTGETVVALGARPERGEGIVTGDVVNVAARLQSAAPVGSVIVDETTMRSAEAAITFEPIDPVAAKGKAEPIQVWRVVSARSRVGQPEAATRTPFVGREHERTLLLETFLRAERESAVQLVTVVGEPGIGKSRLVTELRATLDERPELVTWRHGRCLPYGEGITFWALGEIIKAEAGILESDDVRDTVSKLDRMLVDLFPDGAERVWFHARLGPLVGVGDESVIASREESFTAWRRFLETLAALRPCVVVLEDLHWADGAMFEFVEHLVDWSTPVPLLVLCTARPELFERRSSWGGGKRNATTISLLPLSTEESSRLLHALLDRGLLPAETQAALLERSGGNPLYAEQFARMLQERGGAEGLALPESVQALLAARMDTLAPELKALLHDASVVGRIFWSGAVAAIGDRDPNAVRSALNELVRREFVRPIRVSSIDGEDELAFWHALTRDVAYAQIPRAPRAQKHVAAAQWIERTAGARVADHAEILVHHYGEALELGRAVGEEPRDVRETLARFLVLAGERASQLDIAAAEAHYRRALDLFGEDGSGRATVLAKLAGVLAQQGEFADAVDAFERAIPVLRASDPSAAALATRGLSSATWMLGDAGRSRELGYEAIALLDGQADPELVAAYGSVAHRAAISGRLDEAAALVDKGLQMAEGLGVEDVMTLLMARATVLGYSGDPEAVTVSREVRELGLKLGLGRSSAVATNNLAEAIYHFESIGAGLEMWDEAIAFSRSRGITEAERWQGGERLKALYHLGRWDELVHTGSEVLAWARSQGAGNLQVLAQMALADVLAHRGSIDDAVRAVGELLPRAREIGDPQMVVPGLGVAALASWVGGNRDAALDLIAEAEEITRTARGWRSNCLLGPARIAAAAGEAELIQALLDGVEEAPGLTFCALRSATAALAETRGAREDAARLYREAAEVWGAHGSVVEQAYARLGLGRCGDVEAARAAEETFGRLGAQPVLARAA